MTTSVAIGSLGGISLAHVSDNDLLAATRTIVGRSNQLLAALLLHLGEVEARGLHRVRACSSLYTYCIYELRFSEDEAFRRVAAARLVKRFPALFEAVATGELHLTGLLMLGPHLTDENLLEVLARAKHRTKKEIGRLLRVLDPLPDVPPRIEPLGPAPARLVPDAPSWQEFVASMSPVRDLAPGDRPRDWVDGANDTDDLSPAPARVEAAAPPPAPARVQPTVPSAPQRYKVQFTATEEYVRLVEQAKALLSHAVPRGELEELHMRAMRLLVADLEKRKYASGVKPRKRSTGRYIPAAVRRAVFERDGGRCSYVDPSGQRCRETHHLELHHLQPFARDGAPTVENLALRCAAHNALAAEQDFGRHFMEEKQMGAGHESAREASATAMPPSVPDQ